MPRSTADRQQALRERRRAAGIKQRLFWLTDEQFKRVKAYVERLLRGERK